MRTTIIMTVASLMMLLFACTETQITQFSHADKIKIQNDTNWVEITDIDTVDVCISTKFYDNGKGLLIKSESKYIDWFNKTLQDEDYLDMVRNYPQYTNCTEEYQSPVIDFESRDLILYMSYEPRKDVNNRKIFRNDNMREILYLIEIRKLVKTMEMDADYSDIISIPKFPDNYKITFDTLWVYHP